MWCCVVLVVVFVFVLLQLVVVFGVSGVEVSDAGF